MRSRLAAVALSVALVACSGTPDASPQATQRGPSGEPIVIGLWTPPFATSPLLTISNVSERFIARRGLPTQFVYSALYRYDESLAPVPDLAAEPCEVAADDVTITCSLVETTFHDGTPLTADDVAFTYELGRLDSECLWAAGNCFGDMLASIRVVDERTVEFRLNAPNATFLTLILPNVLIESRAVIEAAYATFDERRPDLEAADYHGARDEIFALFEAEAPDCEGALTDTDALLEAAGIEPLPRDQFMQADGEFDTCLYAEATGFVFDGLARSLEASGLEAIVLAYRALSFNRAPVGTGPWRFAGIEEGSRAVFDAFDGYHRGPPATPRMEIRALRDMEEGRGALLAGEIHWLPIPPMFFPEMPSELADEPDLQFAVFPDAAYFMLAYNLREGMLFADHALRTAVELCIDKPATVEATTGGTGDVLYSPVDPISWAYQPDLPRPERDVAQARGLIEASGWTEGPDGIYMREGERLATDVYVRADDSQRVTFMDLVAEQVRDCGIELTVIPADASTVLGPLSEYPHIPGGYEEPFEALFLGWQHGLDPHDTLWHSSTVTSAEQPQAANFMGFSNERADALLDRGIATYDQRERARIYREFQLLLAEERPVLFAWSPRFHDALDNRLGLTDGQLNLASLQWYSRLEMLVLNSEPPGD